MPQCSAVFAKPNTTYRPAELKRQTMADEQQELTAEAIKQRKKREREAAKNAALGIERFTVEVAGVFKPNLKWVMNEHGINNQQDVHLRLLINLENADFETQVWMLRNIATPYEINEKVSRAFQFETLTELKREPGVDITAPSLEDHTIY